MRAVGECLTQLTLDNIHLYIIYVNMKYTGSYWHNVFSVVYYLCVEHVG